MNFQNLNRQMSFILFILIFLNIRKRNIRGVNFFIIIDFFLLFSPSNNNYLCIPCFLTLLCIIELTNKRMYSEKYMNLVIIVNILMEYRCIRKFYPTLLQSSHSYILQGNNFRFFLLLETELHRDHLLA